MKKVILFLVRLIISAGLLIFILFKIDIKRVSAALTRFSFPVLMGSFLVFIAAFFLCFLRWRMLVRATGATLSTKKMLITYWGSQFFILFLPSFVGADIMRVVDLGVHVKNMKRVAATVFLDRVSGYVGLLTVVFVSLAMGFRLITEPVVFAAIAGLCILLMAILFVLFHPVPFGLVSRFLKKRGTVAVSLQGFYEEMFYFRQHPSLLFRNVLISVGIQACVPLVFFLLIRALGVPIDPLVAFIIVPIVSSMAVIPVSIGGLGIREVGTVYFFSKFGIPSDAAVAASLMNFFFLVIVALIGGIVYVLTFHTRRL